MKKFSKILAVIFVVVFTTFAMVACAPNKNPDKALQSLKANGYEAGMVTKATQTDPAFELTFDKIASKIYTLVDERENLVAVVSGSKLSEGETVTILYFNSKDSMEKCWYDARIYLEKDIEKEFGKELVAERKGKIIYVGTEAAIKAARG